MSDTRTTGDPAGSQPRSVIQHPAGEKVIYLRANYVAITGDHCAAMLLSTLEGLGDGWTSISLDEMSQLLLGHYGRKRIMPGLDLLCEQGFLMRRNNPGDRYDRTVQYRLIPGAIQAALAQQDSE